MRRKQLLDYFKEKRRCSSWKQKGTRRRRMRRKQLLDDFKEKRRCSSLNEEELDCTLSRTYFGRCYGPVARQVG